MNEILPKFHGYHYPSLNNETLQLENVELKIECDMLIEAGAELAKNQ